MADEITVTASLNVSNGSQLFRFAPAALSVTQTAQGGPTPGYWTVGTTEENNAFPELTTEGWLAMQNLDSTNYVEWGFATGVYGGRLRAGEFAMFRTNPGLTLFMKANTAACKVVVYCFES
jgi:hypothetical protein